jgi:hypothetical protein
MDLAATAAAVVADPSVVAVVADPVVAVDTTASNISQAHRCW